MSREDPQLRIRLPVEIKEKIERSAKSNNRSMNAEIIAAIEAWISGESDELHQKNVDRVIRIATKAFREEISKNYDLVPKIKDE